MAAAGIFPCWPWLAGSVGLGFALVVWCMLVLVGQIFQAVAGASMSIGGEGGSDGASSSALTWRNVGGGVVSNWGGLFLILYYCSTERH